MDGHNDFPSLTKSAFSSVYEMLQRERTESKLLASSTSSLRDIVIFGNEVHPHSIHGVLWLQTHFEDDEWDDILSGKAELHEDTIDMMLDDLSQAGLKCHRVKLN